MWQSTGPVARKQDTSRAVCVTRAEKVSGQSFRDP